MVYWDEILNIHKLLSYKFNEIDNKKEEIVSLTDFKSIIRQTKFLTPKEKNLLIRLQKNETIKYSEFPDMLYNVRYEIAMSEMMESNMSNIEASIVKEFAHEDTDDTGEISVLQAEVAMKRCKALNLTPF